MIKELITKKTDFDHWHRLAASLSDSSRNRKELDDVKDLESNSKLTLTTSISRVLKEKYE